ncbi:hypothetical protein [Aliivibrio fischeri]|uniref:hypothetical protein n=1 Tax=Aliivibrio fischeri TaxID=668 RepID=UPI0012D99BB8|nr:hypothetical protein [Aliivibrio fischeri]MUJ20363.1 hypothetical protein [Aliivibrio fischeri]
MQNQTTIQSTNLLELNCFSNLHKFLLKNNEFCDSLVSNDLEDSYAKNQQILEKCNLANQLRLDALNFYVDMYKLGFGSDSSFKSLLTDLESDSEYIDLDIISDDLSKSVCDLYNQYLQYFDSFFNIGDYMNADFMDFTADLTIKNSDTFQGLSLLDTSLCIAELQVQCLSTPYRNAVMEVANLILSKFNGEAISIHNLECDEEHLECLTGDAIGITSNYISKCKVEDVIELFGSYGTNEILNLTQKEIIETLFQSEINKNGKDETLADYDKKIIHHLSSMHEYFGEDSLILNDSIIALKYLDFVSTNTKSNQNSILFEDNVKQIFELLPPPKTNKEKQIHLFFTQLKKVISETDVCTIERIHVQTDEGHAALCNVVSYDYEDYDLYELYEKLGSNVDCSGCELNSFVDSASDIDPLLKLNSLTRVLMLALLKATETDSEFRNVF